MLENLVTIWDGSHTVVFHYPEHGILGAGGAIVGSHVYVFAVNMETGNDTGDGVPKKSLLVDSFRFEGRPPWMRAITLPEGYRTIYFFSGTRLESALLRVRLADNSDLPGSLGNRELRQIQAQVNSRPDAGTASDYRLVSKVYASEDHAARDLVGTIQQGIDERWTAIWIGRHWETRRRNGNGGGADIQIGPTRVVSIVQSGNIVVETRGGYLDPPADPRARRRTRASIVSKSHGDAIPVPRFTIRTNIHDSRVQQAKAGIVLVHVMYQRLMAERRNRVAEDRNEPRVSPLSIRCAESILKADLGRYAGNQDGGTDYVDVMPLEMALQTHSGTRISSTRRRYGASGEDFTELVFNHATLGDVIGVISSSGTPVLRGASSSSAEVAVMFRVAPGKLQPISQTLGDDLYGEIERIATDAIRSSDRRPQEGSTPEPSSAEHTAIHAQMDECGRRYQGVVRSALGRILGTNEAEDVDVLGLFHGIRLVKLFCFLDIANRRPPSSRRIPNNGFSLFDSDPALFDAIMSASATHNVDRIFDPPTNDESHLVERYLGYLGFSGLIQGNIEPRPQALLWRMIVTDPILIKNLDSGRIVLTSIDIARNIQENILEVTNVIQSISKTEKILEQLLRDDPNGSSATSFSECLAMWQRDERISLDLALKIARAVKEDNELSEQQRIAFLGQSSRDRAGEGEFEDIGASAAPRTRQQIIDSIRSVVEAARASDSFAADRAGIDLNRIDLGALEGLKTRALDLIDRDIRAKVKAPNDDARLEELIENLERWAGTPNLLASFQDRAGRSGNNRSHPITLFANRAKRALVPSPSGSEFDKARTKLVRSIGLATTGWEKGRNDLASDIGIFGEALIHHKAFKAIHAFLESNGGGPHVVLSRMMLNWPHSAARAWEEAMICAKVKSDVEFGLLVEALSPPQLSVGK